MSVVRPPVFNSFSIFSIAIADLKSGKVLVIITFPSKHLDFLFSRTGLDIKRPPRFIHFGKIWFTSSFETSRVTGSSLRSLECGSRMVLWKTYAAVDRTIPPELGARSAESALGGISKKLRDYLCFCWTEECHWFLVVDLYDLPVEGTQSQRLKSLTENRNSSRASLECSNTIERFSRKVPCENEM